jgi:hypothetical protein
MHFPWIFPAARLERFCRDAALEPFEEGFVDRWLAAQLIAMGLGVRNLQETGEGFSRNTIESREDRKAILRLAGSGGYAFHGIKEEDLLCRVLRAAGLSRLAPEPLKDRSCGLWRLFGRVKPRRS